MYLLIILLIVLIYIIWNNMCKPVYWFYRLSCPYCVKMHDEWKRFKGMTMFSMVKPIEIDITKPENKDIVDKYQISSVPQLIKIEKNIPIIYDGDRVAEDIYQWACSN